MKRPQVWALGHLSGSKIPHSACCDPQRGLLPLCQVHTVLVPPLLGEGCPGTHCALQHVPCGCMDVGWVSLPWAACGEAGQRPMCTKTPHPSLGTRERARLSLGAVPRSSTASQHHCLAVRSLTQEFEDALGKALSLHRQCKARRGPSVSCGPCSPMPGSRAVWRGHPRWGCQLCVLGRGSKAGAEPIMSSLHWAWGPYMPGPCLLLFLAAGAAEAMWGKLWQNSGEAADPLGTITWEAEAGRLRDTS